MHPLRHSACFCLHRLPNHEPTSCPSFGKTNVSTQLKSIIYQILETCISSGASCVQRVCVGVHVLGESSRVADGSFFNQIRSACGCSRLKRCGHLQSYVCLPIRNIPRRQKAEEMRAAYLEPMFRCARISIGILKRGAVRSH